MKPVYEMYEETFRKLIEDEKTASPSLVAALLTIASVIREKD